MVLKGKNESEYGWGRSEGKEGEEVMVKEGGMKKGSSKGRKEGRMESVDQIMSGLGTTKTFRVIISPL